MNELVSNYTSVIWSGQSRQQYEFQLHRIGTGYYDKPGVYIFCKARPDGRWDAIYVGETNSFKDRLTDNLVNHHRWQCIQAHGATHICTFHVTGGNTSRVMIERDLRSSLSPPCNRQ
jgi:excinuclease UvrABC nuclease subunit